MKEKQTSSQSKRSRAPQVAPTGWNGKLRRGEKE